MNGLRGKIKPTTRTKCKVHSYWTMKKYGLLRISHDSLLMSHMVMQIYQALFKYQTLFHVLEQVMRIFNFRSKGKKP